MHLGALCMQLRAPVSFYSLWEGQKWVFSTLSTKSQTFYIRKKRLLCRKARYVKMGFFSLRIAHIALFYTINVLF